MEIFEKKMEEKISEVLGNLDPAHDILHVKRVVAIARKIATEESADLNIILPAAWLHDIVNLPKNHVDRKRASTLAAQEAIHFLGSIFYPEKFHDGIAHAIRAHSFSANIKPETIEAKIVQDADRLDALGAIGLARLFSVSTQLGRPFYSQVDPLFEIRDPNDKEFAIDHIEIKLKIIAQAMNTNWAKAEALRRYQFIEQYLNQLKNEIC